MMDEAFYTNKIDDKEIGFFMDGTYFMGTKDDTRGKWKYENNELYFIKDGIDHWCEFNIAGDEKSLIVSEGVIEILREVDNILVGDSDDC